ncbi:uncharacterized protein [Vulpes vulpes]|uniref:Uncharacterized protein n=1 Tax=Vulpes vulpes TaxID=9627 RepID=A0ABM5AFF0_VULVU
MGTLTRARSLAEFPVGYPEDPPTQNFVKFGTHLKEGTKSEQDPRAQNPLHPVPTQLPPLPSAYLQDQYKLRAPSWTKAFQDTPCEYLCLENQLGQDFRCCPVSSCLPAKSVSLSTEEAPAPTECKSEHRPESLQQEPRGTGPAPNVADVSDRQKHLQDTSVEAGNQTSSYRSKSILSEKRKHLSGPRSHFIPATAGCRCGTDWMGCCKVGNCSVAPETTLIASATDTSKEVEDAMVLDSNCTKSALPEFSETTAATVPHCSGGDECEQGLEAGVQPPSEGLKLEPTAGRPRGGCTLLIITVEQKGPQATRTRAGPLSETQPEFLEKRPRSPRSAEVTPSESSGSGKPQTCGSECKLSACSGLGRDHGSLWQRAQATELTPGLLPSAAPQERPLGKETFPQELAQGSLSTGDTAEENLPGASQTPGTKADREEAAGVPGPYPEGIHGDQGLHHTGSQRAQSPKAGRGVGGAEDPEKECGTPASAPAQALPPPGPSFCPCKTSQEPGKRLTFPKVTSLRKSKPTVTKGPGRDAGAQGPSTPAPTTGSSGLRELAVDSPDPTACWQNAAGWDVPPTHRVGTGASQKVFLQGAGLREGDNVETPGDLGSRTLSSESCDAKRLKTPEKRFRARLALAHKTFANFFESRVLEKENTDDCSLGFVKGRKEKSRPWQSSWCAFLKSKDAEGTKRPLVSLVPGQEILNPFRPSPPGPNSHCEEQVQDQEGCVFGDHWSLPHLPTPLTSSSLVSPHNRRKSEPNIKCTSPRESGRYLTSGIFPEKSWLMSPTSPHTQQAGISCTLPSRSACCLACGSQGTPCKPMSPKPRSPRPGVHRADLQYSGRSSAVSMVSLGSSTDVVNNSEASERPKTLKTRASLLLSLQTLDQDDQKEESRKTCWNHHGLSIAPSLRDLPGSENHMRWEEQSKKPICSHSQKALYTELQRPFSTTEMVAWTLPSISAAYVPRETPQPRNIIPRHSRISLDDLWLEKTQRRRLKKQVQVERKMHKGITYEDGIQCWRKVTVTSPESLSLARRSHPFSQSAPTGLNCMGWPQYIPDTGEL